MKKIVLFLFISLFLMAGEGLEYTVGLQGGYNSLKAKIGEQNTSLNLTQAGLKNSVLIDETKEFYFGLKYGKVGFGDELNFISLPISLQTSYSKPDYSVFVGAYWEPYVFSEEVSIVLNPEVSYVMSSHKWDVEKSTYLTGSVEGKISLLDVKIGILAMYEGQESMEPYIGVYFEYFLGNVSFHETFQDLDAKDSYKIKPQMPLQIVVGSNFYSGEHLSGGLSVGFLNGLSFCGEVGFTF